jgi:hypothetical protein
MAEEFKKEIAASVDSLPPGTRKRHWRIAKQRTGRLKFCRRPITCFSRL